MHLRGEVLFTTAVVTAYDYLLDQPDMWGVDVINNSWGNSYAQFDPRNPVATATKAAHDAGAVVVFAAGNSGDGDGEATLNPFSQAPWVVSVAAESVDHVRGSFSSNGFPLRQLAAHQHRRRRTHHLHRRPTRPRPPRCGRTRRGHLVDV